MQALPGFELGDSLGSSPCGNRRQLRRGRAAGREVVGCVSLAGLCVEQRFSLAILLTQVPGLLLDILYYTTLYYTRLDYTILH